MKRLLTAVLVAALFLTPLAYGAPAGIGTVRSSDGEVVILRDGQVYKAAPKVTLYEGDVIETGSNGKAGLTMADETAISMGRKSRLVLTRLQFRPDEKNPSFLVRVLQGTASFICGKIEKVAPKSFRIETPQAAIGVRGSHVLVKVD